MMQSRAPQRIPGRKPGRPLRLATSEAILAATARILAEGGYARLTIDRVAENAGVARASIIRRWPEKLALVVDLFTRLTAAVPPPNTGSLASDLTAHFDNYIAGVPTPGGRIMPALIAESFNNRELAVALHDVYLVPRRDRAIQMLQRAIDRGEIRAGTDPAIIADMITGFVWQRRDVSGQEMDASVAQRFIALLLDGLSAANSISLSSATSRVQSLSP
jgi:AcrR family transcriptional regulator